MKVVNNFPTSTRQTEHMFPPNPRRLYQSCEYNWQQQNSSRGMVFGTRVTMRDAAPYAVPINPRRETARDLHFPRNNNESNPPTITPRSDEIMVSFYKITCHVFVLWLLLMCSCALRLFY